MLAKNNTEVVTQELYFEPDCIRVSGGIRKKCKRRRNMLGIQLSF